MCLDNPEDHGWSPDGATIWSNNVFPEDVKDAPVVEIRDFSLTGHFCEAGTFSRHTLRGVPRLAKTGM